MDPLFWLEKVKVEILSRNVGTRLTLAYNANSWHSQHKKRVIARQFSVSPYNVSKLKDPAHKAGCLCRRSVVMGNTMLSPHEFATLLYWFRKLRIRSICKARNSTPCSNANSYNSKISLRDGSSGGSPNPAIQPSRHSSAFRNGLPAVIRTRYARRVQLPLLRFPIPFLKTSTRA